jgi:DNA-binding response OmpR family regulator
MLSCLIAEDEAITGMALAEAAEEADFRVLGPFSRCSAVLEALTQVTPDAAILDVTLKDGPSTAIALALRERAVPFVICSGHRRANDVPPAFAEAPWVEKPATPTEVLSALRPVL